MSSEDKPEFVVTVSNVHLVSHPEGKQPWMLMESEVVAGLKFVLIKKSDGCLKNGFGIAQGIQG